MANELIEAAPRHLAPYAAGPVATIEDAPQNEIRIGLIIAGLFFVLFLGWAAFARMDAAAYAGGRVTVSGQRQTVQHRDGGVVGAINVKEGQHVQKGQVLLQLAAAEVHGQERALASQVIGLLAQRARLTAEELGLPNIPAPPEYATLSPEDKAQADQVMKIQQLQLHAQQALLSTQQGVLGQQRAQVGEQGQGYERQLVAINEQERIISEQLESMRTVAEKGFVSKNRIRDLERAQADLIGQRGRLQASIASSGESVGESRLRIVETERTYQDKIATDLREAEFSLGELMPKWRAARDQVARTEVRAPATGTVVGLTVFTEGGVIQAGQRLMDIVPDRMPMVVEAKVAPNDIDDLRVGQIATVKFTGLHDRDLPRLEGKLTRISADSFNDEKSGQSYFTAEVSVPPEDVRLIQERRGKDFALKPGMPVEVLVPLRKRTALQYLFEPLTDMFWRSFREH
jgi:HlyD family secretion protein